MESSLQEQPLFPASRSGPKTFLGRGSGPGEGASQQIRNDCHIVLIMSVRDTKCCWVGGWGGWGGGVAGTKKYSLL